VEDTYYFRYLNGNVNAGATPRIKFNIPDPGIYVGNAPFEVVKVVPIEIPDALPELPPAERDRWKDIKLVYNPEMNKTSITPIRIYSDTGVVEYGPRFLQLIPPIQVFLIEHERGHLFYKTEQYCDMYALLNFIRKGYNQSTAYYALTHILSRTKENAGRIKTIFNNIQKVRKK
jgi:hypothetical protein